MKLSIITLILTFALPFSYFGYTATWWHKPKRIALSHLWLGLFSVAILVLAAISIYQAGKNSDVLSLQIAFAHLGNPLIALVLILRGWNHSSLPSSVRSALERERGTREASSSYTPKNLHGSVEEYSWDKIVINSDLKRELQSVVELLRDPESASEYGISVPKGILLSGPPGTGKTTIAKVLANAAGLSFFALRPDEIVSKWVGESEKNLAAFFQEASRSKPAVVFIDEIDALGKKRAEGGTSHSDSLVNQLLQLMDGVIALEGIYIIAATNRPELVDDALKRAGRLNRTIEISLPDITSRAKLFELYTKQFSLGPDIRLDLLTQVTEGNSAADIREICNQAGLYAFQREGELPSGDRTRTIQEEDFSKALSEFELGSEELAAIEQKQNGNLPMPQNDQIEHLTWADVVVDEEIMEDFSSVIELLKRPETARQYGIEVPKGILLGGPPGTGKTTIAKIIANTAGLSFFSFRADEVVSKWVGESEKNLTKLFKAAKHYAPAVIFIDEIDSIGKNRSEGNSQHADNLLNHLLQLMDGVIKTEGVYVIGATNRAELVDPALKRGGRLNRVIEVPLPGFEARKRLFSLFLSSMRIDSELRVDTLASATRGYSPADIRAICNDAGVQAFRRESREGSREFRVAECDFEKAMGNFEREAA